ncbi:hypothetical protein FGG08_006570 [Glutinoglossum americanum]|uniref:NACHT domain-containing protein n=1 Tax=Glutinoglossum americanum TaxID=1670608 RepID=A0A9P8L081_9PEZI|nr:hypothetical protein FGG08_006570 [Glutinoglossum americanum]
MAELAALGLAGNIVQFVDFGIKLFSEGWELYKSTQGICIEGHELEIVTVDLKRLTGDLRSTTLLSLHAKSPSTDDIRLRELAGSCGELADELLKLLDDLKVKGLYHRKWKSFKQALNHARKQKKIKNLEERLKKFQEQIGIRLIAILRLVSHLPMRGLNQQSTVLSTIRGLREANSRLESNTMDGLDDLKSQLIDFLRKQAENGSGTDSLDGLPAALQELAEEGKRVRRQQEILNSLCFKSIKVRQDAIKNAYADTFEWIFKSPQINFREWLYSGNGIYWVRGKAGSGKSTLLRFLSEHYNTKAALRSWAGGHKLFAASYFFWNAGNMMQKSQEGLLQTLLYQVLKQCPNLIPSVCSVRWDASEYGDSAPWSYSELFEAFKRLAEQTLSWARLCFFIDGLDEYSGDHTELARLLKESASSPSIKICVSSRPWNPFVDAFGESNQQLKLEDLTKDDIMGYVESKLEGDGRFRDLENEDSRRSEIVHGIAKKAQGVFLWVRLVVDSLLRGLAEGDDVSDMRDRLDSFPGDLEDYFRLMLRAIDPFYREQTARIFQTTIQAVQPLPALAFEFLDKERENPDYALKAQIIPYQDPEIRSIYEKTKKRLNARCRDLLEVNIDSSEVSFLMYKVDFLHRTVRDFFLQTNAMEEILKGGVAADFDARMSLCRVMLALTKALPMERGFGLELKLMFSLVGELMYYAREIEIRCAHQPDHSSRIPSLVGLLDELDRVITAHIKGIKAYRINARDPADRLLEKYRQKTFLGLAVQAKLTLYVRQKLDNHPKRIGEGGGQPLLDCALRPAMITLVQLPHQDGSPDVGMVRLLLEKGANPNQSVHICDGQTVWGLFVRLYYENTKHGSPSRSTKDWYDVVKMLTDCGANPDLRFWTIDDSESLNPFFSPSLEPRANGPFLIHRTNDDSIGVLELLGEILPDNQVALLKESMAEKRQSRFGIRKVLGFR